MVERKPKISLRLSEKETAIIKKACLLTGSNMCLFVRTSALKEARRNIQEFSLTKQKNDK